MLAMQNVTCVHTVVYVVFNTLIALFLYVSSQRSGLREGVPAGHPAVGASLLPDSGSLEAPL